MTDELTAFIEARLEDDETAAQNAGGEVWDFTGVNCEVRVREGGKCYGEFGRVVAYCRHGNPLTEDLALALHVAQHDPARALREAAAKRALVDAYQTERERGFGGSGFTEGLELALRHAAAAWGDHPDYREEWRPQ